jgi:hypothetical protein
MGYTINMENQPQHQMQSASIEDLISSRLEDNAKQYKVLIESGDLLGAETLRLSGVELAGSYDSEESFLYVNDLN